jgi:hypothetical protein
MNEGLGAIGASLDNVWIDVNTWLSDTFGIDYGLAQGLTIGVGLLFLGVVMGQKSRAPRRRR